MSLFNQNHDNTTVDSLSIRIPEFTEEELKSITVVPNNITVHLGAPNEPAENVTVPFSSYIKNVASSELYPTWPENALRANIHAIISIAMNRINTEWYRAQGYNFDITSSTQYDQAYVHNRGIYDNISNIVDQIFNQYLIREGTIDPLYAEFCDGRISQCNGMYQWGSVDLANEGYTPIEILRYYYGDDVNIVLDAPVGSIQETYPGTPLKPGDSNINVFRIQYELDRISLNYPAIPKIQPIDGYYGESTEAAVRQFQKIFNLPVTGIIDKGTWYKIRYIYNAVTKLAELSGEGIRLSELIRRASAIVVEGSARPGVEVLQYFLTIMSLYYETIPEVAITGIFDDQTRLALIEYQNSVGLNPTGILNQETWSTLYNNVLAIFETLAPQAIYLPYLRYPGIDYSLGMGLETEYPGIFVAQEMLNYISLVIPGIPFIEPTGIFDETTEEAVIAFQSIVGLEPTGIIDEETWNKLVEVYRQQRYSGVRLPGQTAPEEVQNI